METLLTTDAARLLGFYRGSADGPRGVRIHEVWDWDHETLEERHDFIQWLFPTNEPSGFNSAAPTLDPESLAAFHADPDLKQHLLRSLRVMLDFYGLRLDKTDFSGIPVVTKTEGFPTRKANWLANPHNHLRISRILSSLNALGLPEYARAFFACLTGIYEEEHSSGGTGRISATTFAYWKARAEA